MSWSNIYMQLITKVGPIPGEGQLDGFQGSIELKDFSWKMDVLRDPGDSMASGGSALSQVGGALASMAGFGGNERNVQMSSLTFTKRFDLSSALIHTALDNHINVVSASIVVLNIDSIAIPGGGPQIHKPGFTLVATDGYFTRSDLTLSGSGGGAELMETVTLSFKMIVITYLKRIAGQNVPTLPFVFKRS